MEKRRLIAVSITVLFVITVITTLLHAQEKASFKSAVVKYQISGAMQNGKQELYMDDYGKKSCTIMKLTVGMGNFSTTTNNMIISNGNDHYNIDLARGTGTKTTMTPAQKKRMMAMAKQMMPSPEEIKSSWKKVGTEKVLGKPCDIYEGSGVKSWIWKGLLLKSEATIMGNYLMKAVSVEVNVPISKNKFEPPRGVTIVEQKMELPPGF